MIKDKTGMVYGRLTVVSYAGRTPSNAVQWLCKCSCDKEIVVRANNLTSGNTKSCGCLGDENRLLLRKKLRESAVQSLLGQTFGQLKAVECLEESGSASDGSLLWRCECSCGNKDVVVPSYILRQGRKVDCGCVKEKEERAFLDSTFGELKVVKRVPVPEDVSHSWAKDHSWYLCQCTCGGTRTLNRGHLLSGMYKSCGCRSRDHLIDDTNVSLLGSKVWASNTSGVRGVSWNERDKVWRSYIGFKKQRYDLGYFKRFEDAVAARREAEQMHFEAFLEWYETELRPRLQAGRGNNAVEVKFMEIHND